MSKYCYVPPPGHIDEYFMYGYNTDALTNGSSYANLYQTIQAPYDFILRRIVGLDSVLQPNGSYRFQNHMGTYLSASAINVTGSQDMLIVPELVYPQTSQIRFDLNLILNKSRTYSSGCETGATVLYGQIGFGGVRRRQASCSDVCESYTALPFQTSISITINWQAYTFNSSFVPIAPYPTQTFYLPIKNYATEIFNVQVQDTINNSIGGYGQSSCKLTLFNAANQPLSNVPIVAAYLSDSIPWGRASCDRYNCGSFVPTLEYPEESNIRIDVNSLLFTNTVPQTVTLTFTGIQKKPK